MRALLFAIFATAALAAAAKPNVVFFFSDDQAYDTLGCYGNPDVQTPNLDKLAARGVCFDRHYNTTAICMASRANVMTGLYEHKHGTNFNHGPMTRAIWNQSYPVLLRKAGYLTAFGGKFGFAVADTPGAKAHEGSYDYLPMADFDFWAGGVGQTDYRTAKNKYLAKYADQYPHSTRAYGAAGQDFIRQAKAANKPFCLSLYFKAPHRPTTSDPAFDDVYKHVTFRKLPNYGRPAGEHLAPQSKRGRQFTRFEGWGYHTEDSYQKAMRTYHQQIYGVDVAVGMVLDELEKQGLADNTIVIFSSDNGFFNGSHGLGSKVLPYEEGSRVPLIVYDPRAPQAQRGVRNASVTGNIDLTATILDAAGIQPPATIDGKSLLPVVHGKSPAARESLTLIQAWGAPETFCLSIVTNKHKYVFWPDGDNAPPTEELFDLAKDAYEMQNFIANPEYGPVLETMRKQHDQAVADWKREAVAHNNYQSLATLYDRTIPWNQKKPAASNDKKRNARKSKKRNSDDE